MDRHSANSQDITLTVTIWGGATTTVHGELRENGQIVVPLRRLQAAERRVEKASKSGREPRLYYKGDLMLYTDGYFWADVFPAEDRQRA
jgi:hypothetical protein